MNSNNNTALNNESTKTYLITAMAIVAIIVAILSSNNTVRNYFAPVEGSGRRSILAKLFTTFDETHYVIFKIRSENGIDIEIYEKDGSTYFQKLKQKFSFPEDKDAFLMVDGNSISLALSDVNQDGVMDIVMPTVDQFGLSRLNVFKYNSDLKQFSQSVEE